MPNKIRLRNLRGKMTEKALAVRKHTQEAEEAAAKAEKERIEAD